MLWQLSLFQKIYRATIRCQVFSAGVDRIDRIAQGNTNVSFPQLTALLSVARILAWDESSRDIKERNRRYFAGIASFFLG